MTFSDETLMAFADGELKGEEAARIEAAIKEDATLAKRVARFRSVRTALKMTYDSVAEEPIPERFRALLGDMAVSEREPAPAAKVVDFAAAREQRRMPMGAPAWAAIAATLVVGLFAGRMIAPGEGLLVAENGRVRAGGELTRALDTQLASATENEAAALRIGLSFRSRDGEYCRTFTRVTGERAVSGVACRDPDAWVVQVAASEAAPAGAYRQAASSTVMDRVDALIEGEPLDAETERAARDRGWH